MRPYCIGLTGGIGSGKSTVASHFAALGVALLDADVAAHAVTAAGGAAMPGVRQAFGDASVQADGALDRAYMRGLVFSDPAARRRLEAIVHPLVRARLLGALDALDARTEPYAVLVVPLLYEHWPDYAPWVDRVLVVDCDEASQLRRIMGRSGLSEEVARAMLAAQATRAERLGFAHDVLPNEGSLEQLPGQVGRLHARYLRLAREKAGRMDAGSLP